MVETAEPRTYKFFEFINRRIKVLSIGIVLAAVVLGVVAPMVAADGEPRFDPGGEIYDTQDLAEDLFSSDSAIRSSLFVVEVPDAGDDPNAIDHDVLTAAALLELKVRTDAARAKYSTGDNDHLATSPDHDIAVEIDGLYSIADAVDSRINGGLTEVTTDLEVKMALHWLLADFSDSSVLRSTLSVRHTREPQVINGNRITIWRSPALFIQVRWDLDSFDPAMEIEGHDGMTNLDAERWLRDLQTDLRSGPSETAVLGIAIDGALVSEEGGNAAAPYIFMAVALILLLVGALLRSYWAAIVAAMGLSVVMMSYNGINSLIGLKVESPLIIFIVPIALISFGVDFFVHGAGRAREAQVEGYSSFRAYPIGATLVFTGLLLAAASSVGAFLSNTSSGIEAIIEFGIAAAVAIAVSYLMLGLIAPRQLLAIEEALGPHPEDHGLHVVRRVGFLLACILSGIVVTMTIVMPIIGAPLFLVLLVGLLFGLPYWATKRRNLKAAAAGKPMSEDITAAGHGFPAAGSVVHFLARWRVFTVPVVAVLAVVGVWAYFQVDSQFDFRDFFSSKTDFVKSLDKVETHLGSGASGTGYILVEGDLTNPDVLLALEAAATDVADSDATLVRDFLGEVKTTPNAASLVRMVTASPPAAAAVAAGTGVMITDDDGNGLPDSPEQVGAIYEHIADQGVAGPGFTLLRADQVRRFLAIEGEIQATRVEVVLPSVTVDANVLAARSALDAAATDIREALGANASTVSVSGSAIVSQASLAAFTDAMVVSLPLAILITALLALLVMRSFKYALISMVPVILVVAWLHGFMYLMGFHINPITATIAAIAIGIGIDYATHFTVRFRQEFIGDPSRHTALRRAGEGTGGALVISALTSVTGFLVMAASPMPMFSTFGILTAAMVFLALVVSLLVLPSLLLLVTPSRKGEERAALEEAITGGRFKYDPHSRSSARLPRKGHNGAASDPEEKD